jgi:hypothetical protein
VKNFTLWLRIASMNAARPMVMHHSRLLNWFASNGKRASGFPAFYKEFISTYGAGEFGSVTVLSPDPKSRFTIWETTSRLENRECNFMGVVESDSDYYGFLIEQGVCSNDIWSADHELGYEIGSAGYTDFF